jgi:hypothetical protein
LRNWQKDWELCEKATPGPWDTHDGDIFDDGLRVFEESDGGTVASQLYEEDAQFIAEAREALPYWLTKYRELYERTIDELSRVELEKEKLERDLAITREQWEGLKAMYVSMYEKAGKVISAAKDTCEELMGHGLYAIATLMQALADMEGVTGDSE